VESFLFPSIAHQNPFVPINFLLFPTQTLHNPTQSSKLCEKDEKNAINFFFLNLETRCMCGV